MSKVLAMKHNYIRINDINAEKKVFFSFHKIGLEFQNSSNSVFQIDKRSFFFLILFKNVLWMLTELLDNSLSIKGS